MFLELVFLSNRCLGGVFSDPWRDDDNAWVRL